LAELNNNPEISREEKMKITQKIGLLLLAAWLILTGLITLIHLSFSGLREIMAILAIVSGILVALGR